MSTHPESNPYHPPADGLVDLNTQSSADALPRLHWFACIGLTLICFLGGLGTLNEFLWFAAFSLLFGGIHTALVYRVCRRAGTGVPPYSATIMFGILVSGIFLILALVIFFSVHLWTTKYPWHQFDLSWTIVGGTAGVGAFVIFYLYSIREIAKEQARKALPGMKR